VRPRVRPGLHMLRRDVRTLQLGVEWPGVAAVTDSPAVRAVLDAVDGFRDVSGVVLAVEAGGIPRDDAYQAVDALLDSGALVDQATTKPATLDAALWSTMWLLSGPRGNAAAVLRSRHQTSVYVEGCGKVAGLVAQLVVAEHLRLTTTAEDATLVVLASDVETSRDRADDAMRRGVPFLCVGIRELVGLVGPFVVPGRTACLRCVDLARAQLDPCWTTLVASMQSNRPTTPAGAPSLVTVTAGYASQEIALWASGTLPATCDGVVEIPHGLGAVQTVPFQQHPECGCDWHTGHETMSA
jgi:hypothetical protein